MYEDDLNQQPNPSAGNKDVTINVEISDIIRNNQIDEVTENKKDEIP